MNERLALVQRFADEQAKLGIHSEIRSGCDLQDLMSLAMEDQRFNALGLHRGDKGMVSFAGLHGDGALCEFLGLATKANSSIPTVGSLAILHGTVGIIGIQKAIERLVKRSSH